jgi:hypothetical protein
MMSMQMAEEEAKAAAPVAAHSVKEAKLVQRAPSRGFAAQN